MEKTEMVHYYEIGQGFPVVLLHGGNVDALSWLFQIPFAYHYRLILPDLRGRGGSPKAPPGCSIDLIASDVNDLLEELNIEKAIMVGASFGGMVALNFALSYGVRVKALVLSDTQSKAPAAAPALRELMSMYSSTDGLDKVKKHLISVISGADYSGCSIGRMLTESWMERFEQIDLDSLREIGNAILAYDVYDRLAEINVPTLIISPKEDTVIQAQQGKEMHDRIKGSEYVEIEGGHGSPLYRADEWNRIVQKFLLNLAAEETQTRQV